MDSSILQAAFSSQHQETELHDLHIEGDIPKWLRGSLISTGPAQFEVGLTPFQHWFDGFSMLKKFEFDQGKARFQNRFLQSQQYLHSNQQGRLANNEFGTYTHHSRLGRLLKRTTLFRPEGYDNCNVNISRLNNHFIALTESNERIAFDPHDLTTKGPFQFQDNLKEHLSTAHPHCDPITKEFINIGIEISHINQYHLYQCGSKLQRRLIQTYVSNDLFYVHSFSITANYVVLFKSPLLISKFKLLLGLPFNNTFYWDKGKPSVFVIIDRRTGAIREIETATFICLHSVNAFEQHEDIVLDLICYEPSNPYDSLYLSNLQSPHPQLPYSQLRRYLLQKNSQHTDGQVLNNQHCEFPRINYQTNGKPYQFVYTTAISNPQSPFFDTLHKMDLRSGTTRCWQKANYYPAEAVFVAKQKSGAEDDGLLLSIAFNSEKQTSSLIILDAITMQQMAEIHLPFHLPIGLHGNFYSLA